MAILAKECPLCGGKMMPPRCASYLTTVDDPGLPIMERHMKVLIYTCETCRYVAMFAPPSPLEEFEKRQAEEQQMGQSDRNAVHHSRLGHGRRTAQAGHLSDRQIL